MVSICMAYFNRKQQLYKTFASINESVIQDYEVVIVDDGSDEQHELDLTELKNSCNGDVKLYTVDKNKKTWYNACIAYNIAFSAASGNKIIIQNPETYHMGDVLKHVTDNLDNSKYLTYQTIALNECASAGIHERMKISEVVDFMQPIFNVTHHLRPGENPYIGHIIWYNHKKYRPVYYHFLTAITKTNLNLLGGFDERYKDDHSWDDNEILIRINRLGLHKSIVSSPMAIHLYHPEHFRHSPNGGRKNNDLYHKVSLKENIIKAQDLDFNNYKQYLKEVL